MKFHIASSSQLLLLLPCLSLTTTVYLEWISCLCIAMHLHPFYYSSALPPLLAHPFVFLDLLTPGSMLKINWFIVVIHWTCQNTPINDNQHSLEGTTKELHFAHWWATYHRLLIDTYLLPNLGQEVHSLLLEQPLDWLSPWWCRSARCQVHSGPISHCFTRISGVCVLGLHFSSSSSSEPLTITLELFHLDNNISSSIFHFFFFFTYLHLIHSTVSNFSK